MGHADFPFPRFFRHHLTRHICGDAVAHLLLRFFCHPTFAQLHSARHICAATHLHICIRRDIFAWRLIDLGCGLRRLEISLPTPQIRQIIAYCDKDKNGKVSIKELEWLLTTVPDKQSIAFNDPPDVRTWLQQEFLPVRRKTNANSSVSSLPAMGLSARLQTWSRRLVNGGMWSRKS